MNTTVFLDAPHILQPIDVALDFGTIERPPEPEQVDPAAEVDPETIPRAWWRANDDKTVYRGVDETLVYVRDFLKKEVASKGPFDVSISLRFALDWRRLIDIDRAWV